MISFRSFYLQEKVAEADYKVANTDIYLNIFGYKLVALSVEHMIPGEHDSIQKLGWLRGMYRPEKDQWFSWNARAANHFQVARAVGVREYLYAFQMAWDRDNQVWLIWSDKGAKTDIENMKAHHPNLYQKVFGNKRIVYHEWK
jgi:hypothetical protein